MASINLIFFHLRNYVKLGLYRRAMLSLWQLSKEFPLNTMVFSAGEFLIWQWYPDRNLKQHPENAVSSQVWACVFDEVNVVEV